MRTFYSRQTLHCTFTRKGLLPVFLPLLSADVKWLSAPGSFSQSANKLNTHFTHLAIYLSLLPGQELVKYTYGYMAPFKATILSSSQGGPAVDKLSAHFCCCSTAELNSTFVYTQRRWRRSMSAFFWGSLVSRPIQTVLSMRSIHCREQTTDTAMNGNL